MTRSLPVSIAAIAAALLAAAPAPAQQPGAADTARPDTALPDSTRGVPQEGGWVRTLQRTPVVGEVMLVGEGIAHAATGPFRWGRDELRVLGISAAGLAALSVLDGPGRSFMERNQSEAASEWERRVEPLGTIESFRGLGVLYAAGLVLGNRKMRYTAAEAVASSGIAAGVITPVLTDVFGRHRPREGESPYRFDFFTHNHSFPSGHTTQAFAVASVIATEYPHPVVQVAAYGTAGLVGLSRMYRGSHFLTDVVAAGLIGTTVGRSIVHYGQRRRERLFLAPAARDGVAYLVLTHTF